MKSDWKFDKAKCRTCMFHGYFGSKSTKSYSSESSILNQVMCDYAKYNNVTCLRRVNGHLEDSRGDDYNQCKLFKKGKRLEENHFN